MAITDTDGIVQIGGSATPTNNFVLKTDGAGGIKLSRGNQGATSQDVLGVSAAGAITPLISLSTPPSLVGSFYETGTWVPIVTAQTGTFTTTSATGTYTRIGRQVTIKSTITLTSVGTAGTSLIINLPFAADSVVYTGTGRESAIIGFGLTCWLNTPSALYIRKYDDTFTPANGWVFTVQMTYFI